MENGSTLGERLASARKRRGLTQRQLAGASGVSLSLVRKVEQGEHQDMRLETARKLAAALRVKTTVLVVGPDVSDAADATTVASWEPVLAALYRPSTQPQEPPTVDGVREAVDSAMPLFADNKYPDLVAILPSLLRDADALGHEGRPVRTFLLRMTGWALIHVRQYDAAELALSRSLDDADSGLEIASSARIRCWMLLHTGRLEECWDSGVRWASQVEPRLSTASPDELSAWGWLQMHNSGAAIRDNRPGDADDTMRMARAAAARIGHEYSHRVDFLRTFGPVTVAMKHAENVMVEDKPDKVLSLAAAIGPSASLATRNNRNRHLIDVANAHLRTRGYAEALDVLHSLRADAPGWLRNQREARDIMGAIVQRRRTLTPEMRELADAVRLPL